MDDQLDLSVIGLRSVVWALVVRVSLLALLPKVVHLDGVRSSHIFAPLNLNIQQLSFLFAFFFSSMHNLVAW